MELHEYIKVLDDGTAIFTVQPYVEEYENGLEGLQKESWYPKAANQTVKRIVTIGGGMDPVETIIELEEN